MSLTILAVGTNLNHVPRWQSPDLPSPTILTALATREGGAG